MSAHGLKKTDSLSVTEEFVSVAEIYSYKYEYLQSCGSETLTIKTVTAGSLAIVSAILMQPPVKSQA